MFLTFQTNRSFIKNETASKEHKKILFQGNKKKHWKTFNSSAFFITYNLLNSQKITIFTQVKELKMTF